MTWGARDMSRIPSEPLRLSDETPIAAGGNRQVYWPRDQDWLVKVMRPEVQRSRSSWLDDLSRRFRPSGQQWAQLREYAAWRALARRAAGMSHLPVARLGGFVATDLGPGFLAEPVLERPPGDGPRALAPTLASLADAGLLNAEHLVRLSGMAHDMLALNIVVRDLSPVNICWGYPAFSPPADSPQFTLIDGLGDKNTIPLRSMVSRVNRTKLQRSFHNLAGWVHCRWDGSSFLPR